MIFFRPRLVSLLCKSANATRKKKAHPAFMIIHVCTDVRASAKKRAEHRLWRTKCPVAGAPENPGGAQASGKILKKRKQNSERSGVQPTFAERPVCAGCSHAHASKKTSRLSPARRKESASREATESSAAPRRCAGLGAWRRRLTNPRRPRRPRRIRRLRSSTSHHRRRCRRCCTPAPRGRKRRPPRGIGPGRRTPSG